jgi:hypothetical protein
MIRVTVHLDATLSPREATGEYDRTDEEALLIIREALHEKGPVRFLQDYGLADLMVIELGIE